MEINRIQFILKRVHGGESWHGPSVKEILEDVTASQAVARPIAKAHNIAELLVHMTNWRVFTLEKLTGGDNYDIILNSQADWPLINELSEERWQEIIDSYDDTQQELVEVIERFSPTKINDTVPGRKYSFYMLLHGIIQHDIYHSGQIALLKKAIL